MDSCLHNAGAAGALLQHLEESEHLVLAAGSLAVQMIGMQHHMEIDPATVQALELVKSQTPGLPHACRHSTLLRWLDRTQTRLGARLKSHSLHVALNLMLCEGNPGILQMVFDLPTNSPKI